MEGNPADKRRSRNADRFQPIKLIKLITLALFVSISFLLIVKPVGSKILRFLSFDRQIESNADKMFKEGRQTFRFDTFGDETFWGDKLKLHQAIEGTQFGGVGPGLSPRAALTLGLKVDVDALPPDLVNQIKHGQVNLDDPAVTLALLRDDAVVGVKGFFNDDRGGHGHDDDNDGDNNSRHRDNSLKSVGINCALCHSIVDDSVAPGIGHRVDGWANRDLDVGQVVALAPDLSPFSNLLGVDQATVRTVLRSWGPGKFDAELILDGKAFNPQQISNGVVTGTNVSGATLIPPAFGLAGVNLHTWTG